MRDGSKVRGLPNWWLFAATGTVLAAFAGLGVYGLAVFTPTLMHENSGLMAGLVCGALSAGCGFLLLARSGFQEKIKPAPFVAVCAIAGYFFGSHGVPALFTELAGREGSVVFTVTDVDAGSRSCGYGVTGTHPDFAALHFCAEGFSPRLRIGERLQVIGVLSQWGISRKDIIRET